LVGTTNLNRYAIGLHPNGIKALERIGIDMKRLRAQSQRLHSFKMLDEKGKVLMNLQTGISPGGKRFEINNDAYNEFRGKNINK
jgi:2-polyprenyl-6-methoxyphenol hydroxylase-like FAD-dependent oxidoreductase